MQVSALRFYIQIVFDLNVGSATLVPKKIVLHHIFIFKSLLCDFIRRELQFCYVLVLVKIMTMSHVVIIMAFLY